MENWRLGALIRRLRRERGVSQNELHRRTGLETSYLSKVENDVILPGLNNLDRIARALGLTVPEVLLGGGKSPAKRRARQRSAKRAKTAKRRD